MNTILCYGSGKLDKSSTAACKMFEKNVVYLYAYLLHVPRPENTQPNLLISRLACSEKKHTFFFPYQPWSISLNTLNSSLQVSTYSLVSRLVIGCPGARSPIAVVVQCCACLMAWAKCCANIAVCLLDTGKERSDLLVATPWKDTLNSCVVIVTW